MISAPVLPGTCRNRAGAQVALPRAPSPLTHSSGSGSDTQSSPLWGPPLAWEALYLEERLQGLLLEPRGLGDVDRSGVLARSGTFLPSLGAVGGDGSLRNLDSKAS